MSEPMTVPEIDKSSWGDGPWQTEPDRLEWKHAGMPCLMIRHPHLGHWCGYAAVPPGHPLYGQGSDDVDLEAHGGVNYASRCHGVICHQPEPGEPDDVYWFGFDCGHCFDCSPGMRPMLADAVNSLAARDAEIGEDALLSYLSRKTYRDLVCVQGWVENLAEQLAEAA